MYNYLIFLKQVTVLACATWESSVFWSAFTITYSDKRMQICTVFYTLQFSSQFPGDAGLADCCLEPQHKIPVWIFVCLDVQVNQLNLVLHSPSIWLLMKKTFALGCQYQKSPYSPMKSKICPHFLKHCSKMFQNYIHKPTNSKSKALNNNWFQLLSQLNKFSPYQHIQHIHTDILCYTYAHVH